MKIHINILKRMNVYIHSAIIELLVEDARLEKTSFMFVHEQLHNLLNIYIVGAHFE